MDSLRISNVASLLFVIRKEEKVLATCGGFSTIVFSYELAGQGHGGSGKIPHFKHSPLSWMYPRPLLPILHVQFMKPRVSLNLPAAQAIHLPPLDPVNPGLHEQLSKSELPEGEVKFSGQAIGSVLIFGWYVPFGDREQFVTFLEKS